ncbi:MAG TPA: hypothetical protein VER08_00735 [Pyrinomonadaceae bacterium]|nr:hypothetical protein [Pyrinomonadaceae bacterium]
MAQGSRSGLFKHSLLVVSAVAVAASGGMTLCAPRAQGRQERKVVRETTPTTDTAPRSHTSHSDTESNWTNGRDSVRVKARNLELSDDGRAIKALHHDGFLSVWEQRGGVVRELRVTPSAGGGLAHSLSVRGRSQPFDAEAQAWLASVLLEFVRNSGFAADRRINSLLSRGGAEAVLAEVSLLPSDNIKRAYLQKLVEQGRLDAANLVRVFEKARREVTSDYELTEFLLAVKDSAGAGGEVRAAFFKALDRLQSDHDRGRVLAAVARAAN